MSTATTMSMTPEIDTDDILMPYDQDQDDDAAMMIINDSLNSFAACFCCNPFETMNVLPEFVSLQAGQAFDGILVTSQSTGRIAASDVLINFDHPSTPFPPNSPPSSTSTASSSSTTSSTTDECQALLEIDDPTLGKVYFPIVHDAMRKKNRLGGRPSPTCDCMDDRPKSFCSSSTHSGNPPRRCSNNHTNHTIPSPPSTNNNNKDKNKENELEALTLLAKLLKPGKNSVRYLFRNSQRVLGVAHASIFLWSDQDRIVVCDVDGTITKTNVRGIYDTIVTEKYGYCHDRVCQFMSSLLQQRQRRGGRSNNDDETKHGNPQDQAAAEPRVVNVLYLTSRPLFIASATRKFLSNLTQAKHTPNNDRSSKRNVTAEQQQDDATTTQQQEQHHRLPEGPLMGFGGRFLDVMKMELVSFTVHLFKASLLMDQVVTPFCEVSDDPHETHQSLFVAGFGNTLMDVQAYHMAGMDLSQIYLIDKKSRIACLDGEELQSKRQTKRQSSSSLSRTSSSSKASSRTSSSNNLSIPNDILGGSNKFLLVDDAQPTETTNSRPCLKTPMSRKSYKQQLGTAFAGYHDARLASHVLDEVLDHDSAVQR